MCRHFVHALQILIIVRKHLSHGGPRRMQFTLPPLIISALKVFTKPNGPSIAASSLKIQFLIC